MIRDHPDRGEVQSFKENQTGFHQQQGNNSLHINTVYTLISEDRADSPKITSRKKYFGKIGHEVLQQAELWTSTTEKPSRQILNLAIST